jgi:putative endonuclease
MTQLCFDFDSRPAQRVPRAVTAALTAAPGPSAPAQKPAPPVRARQLRGALGYHEGRAAEEQVAQDYRRRGYPVLHQRWRGRGGEIDLIVQDGAALIFVEVKKSRSFDRAIERLTPRQTRRLQDAAAEFLGTQPRGSLTEMRFDVALLNRHGEMRVIENLLFY